MLKNKLFIIGIVVLFILIATVFSQDKQVFTLEKSVATVLEQNPDIKIAEKELDKASAGVGEAYANILPQLNASVNFQHSWEIQETTMPNFIKAGLGDLADPNMPDYIKIAFGLENTFNYGAQLTQPIFLGWAGIAGIQTAKAAERAAEQNVKQKKQDLIYQTANVFYGCLMAQELVKVQEEALAQSKANLDNVLKKYDVGSASGFDKMRAEVEYANLQPELISARNNYQSALTGLRTILGLDKDSNIEARGEFKYEEDDLLISPLSDLQDLAIENRPELKALNEQKTMASKGITIARSDFLPKVFFQTDYSYLAQRNNLNFKQDDFSKGFTSAVSIQIPIFSGFKSIRQYQKAKLDKGIILDTEKQVFDGVAAQVEVAYNKLLEANEKYLSAKETVNLATEALRLANLMYDEGANTQLDVLNSQLALTRARLNFVSSLYDYQVARYELRKVTGMLEGIL
jgi:outer membrane protein